MKNLLGIIGIILLVSSIGYASELQKTKKGETVKKHEKINYVEFLAKDIEKAKAFFIKAEASAYNLKMEMLDMVEIPMRDGVALNGRIYFPDLPKRNLPTVLIRSPYFIPHSEIKLFAEEIAAFLQNGYVVVLNNERGRYWSEGNYTFLAGAKNDGYDVIEWIVNQSWSNGKVGTWGCSSGAEHQLGLATTGHPGHTAMIPMAAGAGIGEVGGITLRVCFMYYFTISVTNFNLSKGVLYCKPPCLL